MAWPITLIGGCALLTVFAVVIAWKRADSGLPAEKERLKRLGYPLAEAELRPLFEKPGENAAPLLDEIVAEFANIGATLPTSPADVPRYLAKVKPVHEKLMYIGSREVCYWPEDWDLSDGEFPEGDQTMIALVPVARSFLKEAEFLAQRGDFAGAMQRLELCDHLAAVMWSRPTINSLQKAYHVYYYTTYAYARLTTLRLNAEQSRELLQAVERRPEPGLPRLARLPEPVYFIEVFENPGLRDYLVEEWVWGRLPKDDLEVFLGVPLLRDQLLAELIRAYNETVEGCPLDGSDWECEEASFDRYFSGLKAKKDRVSKLALSIGPDDEYSSRSYANIHVLRNALITAIRLRVASDDVERPRALKDPYTDLPLKVVKRPDHIVVYSFGPDRKDNGGEKGDYAVTVKLEGAELR